MTFFRSTVVLLIGMSACTPPPAEPSQCKSLVRGTALPGTATRVAFVGETTVLTLSVPTDLCGLEAGVTVVTELRDPANRLFAHEGTIFFQRAADLGFGSNQLLARLIFLPAEPGPYHASARFDPALGSAQAEVIVRPATAQAALELGTRCDALEVLASGLAICAKGGGLRLFRGEAPSMQVLVAEAFAVSGNTVWTVAGGTARRHVDDGGTLTETDALTLPTQLRVQSTIASDDAVVVVGDDALVKLSLGAGFERMPIGNPGDVAFADDAFARFGVSRPIAGAIPRVCFVAPGRQFTEGDCAVGLEALGADRGGAWARATDGSLAHVHFVPNGLAVTRGAFTGLARPRATPHFEGAPVWQMRDPDLSTLPAFAADAIRAEAYPLPPGFELMPSGRDTVRAQNDAGTQLLFAR